MPSMGVRRRLTIRVPIHVYVEATKRAAERGWTMTGYTAFALSEQVKRDRLYPRYRERAAATVSDDVVVRPGG